MSLAQLTPELAAELAAAGTAVFVDARKCSPSCEPTSRGRAALAARPGFGRRWSMRITPCVLLGLCQARLAGAQSAWQVSVPGSDFSFGEGLSEPADRGMEQALGMIETLLARAGSPEPGPAPSVPQRSPQATLASQDFEHEHAHHPG